MKKALLIFFLFVSYIIKAQNLNFEETVNYINEKIQCCAWVANYGFYRTVILKAKKNGEITISSTSLGIHDQINLFDLVDGQPGFDDTYKVLKKSNGIILSTFKNYGNFVYEIYLQTTREGALKILTYFETDVEAERVYNALQHLRTLCKKEKDPFDN